MFGGGANRLTGDGDFENQAAADEDFFNRLPFDRPFRIELAPRRQAVADLKLFDLPIAVFPNQRRFDAHVQRTRGGCNVTNFM